MHDLEQLLLALRRGESFTFLPFYGHTPREDGRLSDACFSQWWRCEFEVDGVRYTSAEQFMMAEKARLFGDQHTLAKILQTHEPGAVKKLGREVRNYDDAKWGAARLESVTRGSVAKFSSSSALREFLLSTGDAILVEAAPRDRIWGVGLGRNNPLIHDPTRWRGQNLLGFALVRARSMVRAS